MQRKLSNLVCALAMSASTFSVSVYADTGASVVEGNSSSSATTAVTMADTDKSPGNQMPNPEDYTGLSRAVLQYSDAFTRVVEKIKQPGFSDADWAPLEQLVDATQFQREGVFLGAKAEVIGWEQYKKYITQYGGATSWEGTLRRITEVPGLVILELEERNTIDGVMDVSNTVTIYEFNDAGKLVHLDVYVMPLP